MIRLYLVRHGRAAAGWGEDADPDLDGVGQAQATAVAGSLSGLGPLRVVTSPLLRARSTAAAFERVWTTSAIVDPRVGEIPSPGGEGALERRGAWLAGVMRARWDDADVGEGLRDWRNRVIDALVGQDQDAVVTTHFVAINTAVGHAVGDPRVTCFRPDNCSVTILEVEADRLHLVERGQEGATRVG